MSDAPSDKFCPWCGTTIHEDGTFTPSDIPIFDAVPDQVLADLLIERGALTRVIISAHDCDLYDAGPTGLGIDPRIPTDTPLYRLTPKDPG
jgi:hypothetical protein